MTRAICSVALLFLIPLALAAQEPPTLGESIDVSIVNVDVVVTDREGNRVRGLTRGDFEVYENGVLQEVSNFSEFSAVPEAGRVGVEGGIPAETAPREKRTVVVFFEKMRLSAIHVDPLIEQLKSTVRAMLGPGDEVSLVVWSRYGGIAHVELTSDVASFGRALDTVAKVAKGAQIDHIDALRQETELVREFEEGMAQMASAAGTAPGSASYIDTSAALLLPMMIAYNEMKVRTAAINSAINSMSGIEGKKVLILATRRLGEIAGAEYAYAGGAVFISADLKQRFGAERMIQSIIDNANASRVTIYPIYPVGLGHSFPDASMSSTVPPAAEHLILMNETVSLNQIAKQTGGLMAASAKDAVRLLPRVASDMTDYYSLAYRITPTNTDSARNIVVKTRRPGLTVRARGQFVEKSDDTRMRDRVVATLFQGSPASQIGIHATLGKRQKRRGNEVLPLSIRVPIADLTTLPEGDRHAGSFAVYVASAADLNELSDITEKKQAFELKESQLAAAQAGFFTYDLDLTVNRKAKYVAVGVFDEVGRSYGLVRLNLEDGK
ncbi:MAG TPA: VWA domain-containing protein [Thermoanaerobaculia bacterium]